MYKLFKFLMETLFTASIVLCLCYVVFMFTVRDMCQLVVADDPSIGVASVCAQTYRSSVYYRITTTMDQLNEDFFGG